MTSEKKPTQMRTEPERTAVSPVVKPTLKTISLLSGLAVPTVSRALSDAPDIGAETKKLVRRIADEIGYVPNRAGVRLRTGRTNVISLVLSTEHDMMNHTARLISSLAGALRGTPYHLIMTPYFPGEDPMKPIRYIVETGSADAVIFNQTQPDDPRVAWLMARGFPFATHGRTNWADQHPWFDYDNTAFGRISVQELARRGRRHILLVAPPMAQTYAQHILSGVQDAAALAGVKVTQSQGFTSDSGIEAVGASALELFRADASIDGVICSSTSAAMAVVGALETLGHTLGDDIDLFGKEAIPFLRLFRPQIMTLNEDVRQAGEFLARAAIQAVRQPDLPPLQGLDVPRMLG